MKKITTIIALLLVGLFTNAQVKINSKVMLGGCYDASTGLMWDSLRQFNIIPTTSPYNSTNTSFSMFNATGSNAIVDWVLLSVKSNSITMQKSCLVQRDGVIVDANGNTDIAFNVPDGKYIVQVKHRNHLGCQTLDSLDLSSTSTMIDFTSLSTPLYLRPSPNNNPSPLTGAEKIISGVRCLYPGNCNVAGNYANFVMYSNTSNSDRTSLFNYTGLSGNIFGYSIFDCNLNGYSNFNSTSSISDRLVILGSCNNATNFYVNQQTSF